MADKLFLIGIGGTGMRCLEAFVHLCAIGLLEEKEIHILSLDTDKKNGNRERVRNLIQDCYLKIKGVSRDHFALKDTFFSSKLLFYDFFTEYSYTESNFSYLADFTKLEKTEKDLINLVFTQNVQDFDLKAGYRAQTHLGSLLMYHSIINEIKNKAQSQLGKFIEEIYTASESDEARVFVMGSVFGGTGASSIPIIPKALNDAAGIRMKGKSLSKVFYGSTLLTTYFKFGSPSEKQKNSEKVIADSKNFAMNSQAAMMFYNEDKTVKNTYQKFYMLGTPENNFETQKDASEVNVGGELQKNDSHYIELFTAFAAYNFFNTPKQELVRIKEDKKEVEYYYRTLDDDGKLDFSNFVSSVEESAKFKKNLTALLALSYLVNHEKTDFFASAQRGALVSDGISGYEDIAIEEVTALKQYMNMFNFEIESNNVKNGWIRQLYLSSNGKNFMGYNPEIFTTNKKDEVQKFEYNKIFIEKNDYAHKHNFKTGLFGNPYNDFKKIFKEKTHNDESKLKSERLLKRMYDALVLLYNLEK